jgi:rubrerythrin
VGGFYSSADKTANRYGFLCVMSFLEAKAGGTLAGCTASYWTDHRDRHRDPARVQRQPMCAACGGGRTGIPDDKPCPKCGASAIEV